ncbi:hypothetical protein SEA_FEDE_28 [Microbacterium phage Fede]|nr:hypothetical protein SEA_FEDE_28 [Microbacterium phage Fede]
MDLSVWSLILMALAVLLTVIALIDIIRYDRKIKRLNDKLNRLETGRGRLSEAEDRADPEDG